ncbi:hypothetical protein AB0D38_35635 [Streptomyces sp. NPDC048279]|uniref:hypothetical protein n=1 Tax=Streptomyces sp. NPDC048279 TaxID=3154714 RepID=UPI00342A2E90
MEITDHAVAVLPESSPTSPGTPAPTPSSSPTTEGRRSGPTDMAERAEHLGGRLEWDCPGAGGTAPVWRVPVTRT